jgi:hypothetical protein
MAGGVAISILTLKRRERRAPFPESSVTSRAQFVLRLFQRLRTTGIGQFDVKVTVEMVACVFATFFVKQVLIDMNYAVGCSAN